MTQTSNASREELKQIQEIVESSLQVLSDYPDYPAELIFDEVMPNDTKIFHFIGAILLRHGMVHWQEDGSCMIVCFRPFNYEVDTSLMATIHH